MLRNSLLYGALILLGGVAASPRELFDRNSCNHDNLLRCFIDERYSTQASAYCSTLAPCTETVATVTATLTATVHETSTVATKIDTITSITTVFTATVPSSTITITSTAALKARTAVPEVDPPHCMTNGVTYPASRITSACSCIGILASTVYITHTAVTKTVSSTIVSHVTATHSTTAWHTVSTATTSGVKTVTVTVSPPSPPTDVPNGDFQTGDQSPWQFGDGTHTWTSSIQSVTGSSGDQTYAIVMVDTAGNDSTALISGAFAIQDGKTYKLSFSAKSTVYGTSSNWPSVAVAIYNPSNNDVITVVFADDGVSIGNGWVGFGGQFIVPTTYANDEAALVFAFPPAAGGGTWTLDDVTIKLVS
ncbi:hypothetical protein PT974_05501 [Cladobotryum mycophilum]|uniref:CBM-cenC domain-containing protein n=1 Tax=Cladobotryum mycophilum TaxID=491253 RepID=A0ABR0SIZ1_9HYPO